MQENSDILDNLRQSCIDYEIPVSLQDLIQEAIQEIQWLRAENWLKEGLN